MSRKHNAPFAEPNPKKLKKGKKAKKSRAERRAEKNALLPIHKRPIVCPPDKAGRHPLFRLGGLLARAIVIWLAAAGFVIFFSDALELGVSPLLTFLVSLWVVAGVMLFTHSGIGKIAAGVLAGGGIGLVFALRPTLITDLPYSFVALYNAALTRLHKVGYLAYEQFKVDLSLMTDTPAEALLPIAVGILTLAFSLLFACSFAKRVRLVAPAIVASSVLVIMLTFNIYSNRIESNLGITLIIVSFASVLVMAAYDRLYHGKDDRHYDTELRLFEDSDRPQMPPEYESAKTESRKRREDKAELRAKRRAHVVTVDEELTDYFNADRKSKKSSSDKQSVTEKKAARRAYRQMMKQVRAVKHYDRTTAQSRTAMGGYASLAVLLVCLIAIALPALFIKGNFNTIDAIDEKMELARDYVTALLRGDDDALDRLEYQADRNNFKPHSSELEKLEFTGKQIFYIRSRYNTNYYLRGWIGTDYENGAWLAVDEETLSKYHLAFGMKDSPSEEMRYDFYHFMMPSLVDDPEYNDNLLGKYQANLDYGFVSTLVSMRRVNSPSTLTYFPASYAPQYGLYKFPQPDDTALSPSKLTFVNYYDGLYTGRKFHENTLSYATVAYAPVMKNDYWIENQALVEAAFNLQKEVLLAQSCITVYGDGTVSSDVSLDIYEEADGRYMFKYTQGQGKREKVWRFYHDAYTRSGGVVTVSVPGIGDMILTVESRRVIGATFTPSGTVYEAHGMQDMVGNYQNTMTDEDRGELMDYIHLTQDYSAYVYETYMNTVDSAVLDGVIRDLMSAPDAADAVLAAMRDSSDPAVYMERDRLVRHIIDYIIEDLGCTYTIEPDLSRVDPALDGVENFLANTREGYCVQFASSVALILRELGIPARYADGYIASGLSKLNGNDFIYGGYVRDYQAHAWVEVYYDGIGWIQYETTPQYYVGMYGSSGIGSNPTQPVMPGETETKPDRPNDPIVDPETDADETDADSEETTNADDVTAGEVTRAGLIGLGVLALIAVVAFILYSIVSNAREAEARRQDVVSQVLESGFGENTSEADRREMALEMADAVTNLLAYFELSPKPGEFRDEYAGRLTPELKPQANDKKPADKADDLPDLHMALDGMAAEEFGHGMSIAEMKAVAALYLRLRRDIRRRIPWSTRVKLRYIKRKI